MDAHSTCPSRAATVQGLRCCRQGLQTGAAPCSGGRAARACAAGARACAAAAPPRSRAGPPTAQMPLSRARPRGHSPEPQSCRIFAQPARSPSSVRLAATCGSSHDYSVHRGTSTVCTEAHLVALQHREEQAHVADDAPGQLRQVGAVLVCGAAAQRNLQDLGGAHAEPAGRAVRQARVAAAHGGSRRSAAGCAPAGLLVLFPQLLELVVPHVLILKQVNVRVPAAHRAKFSGPAPHDELLLLARQAHLSTKPLTVVMSPCFHSFVFFLVFVRDTAGAAHVSGFKQTGSCRLQKAPRLETHQACSSCCAACLHVRPARQPLPSARSKQVVLSVA